MNAESVFSNLPALETDRLVLRRLTLEDASDVFAYARDPEVARYTTWEAHRSLDESLRFLKRVLDRYAAGEVAPWGVVHKADDRVIGTCGFAQWRREHARAELAYALARPYWNQGLATEAVRAVVAFGFRTMELNRIEARCEISNVASARVMEKAGMTFEGILRQHMYAKGAYRDLKMYAILREEWLSGTSSRLSSSPTSSRGTTGPRPWRDRGVGEYFGFVHRHNEVGKAFYLKQGFAHDPAHDREDEWCMIRRLLSPGR